MTYTFTISTNPDGTLTVLFRRNGKPMHRWTCDGPMRTAEQSAQKSIDLWHSQIKEAHA